MTPSRKPLEAPCSSTPSSTAVVADGCPPSTGMRPCEGSRESGRWWTAKAISTTRASAPARKIRSKTTTGERLPSTTATESARCCWPPAPPTRRRDATPGASLGFRVQSSEFRVQSSEFRVQSSEFRVQSSEFRVQSSEFRVQSSEFRVQGSGFRVQGSEFRVQSSGFRVQSSGFRVQGSEFRVQGSGFRVQGSVFSVQCSVLVPLGGALNDESRLVVFGTVVSGNHRSVCLFWLRRLRSQRGERHDTEPLGTASRFVSARVVRRLRA